MATNQELAVSRVKLSWSVVNWRSSQEFVSLTSYDIKLFLLSPRFKTAAGDWRLGLQIEVSKVGGTPSTHKSIKTFLKKEKVEGVPPKVRIKGNLKTHSKLENDDLWGFQASFHRDISDSAWISLSLGDVSEIPDCLQLSAIFDARVDVA